MEQAGVDSIEEYRRCLERKIACQKLMDKQEMLAEEKSRWLKQKGMPESMDEEEFQVELEEAARTAPAVIGSAELDEQLAVYERELEAWKLEMERLKERDDSCGRVGGPPMRLRKSWRVCGKSGRSWISGRQP
ncbi:MAG: hypothetical protein ACLR23_11965 [Clostridia bacterium]